MDIFERIADAQFTYLGAYLGCFYGIAPDILSLRSLNMMLCQRHI